MNNKIFDTIILPLGIIIFCYLFIGSILDTSLKLSDLVRVEGNIIEYKFEKYSTQYSTYKSLVITLDNGETYKIPSEWKPKFKNIIFNINHNNRAEIYHRKPYQCLYRLGKPNSVYQLKMGGNLLIGIEERISKSLFLALFAGLTSVIGLLRLYFIKKKTITNKN